MSLSKLILNKNAIFQNAALLYSFTLTGKMKFMGFLQRYVSRIFVKLFDINYFGKLLFMAIAEHGLNSFYVYIVVLECFKIVISKLQCSSRS